MMTKYSIIRGFDNRSKGERFEKEIALSWMQVPNSWRLRIRDGGGGERPADELVILDKYRLLCELKCTNKKSFSTTMLRPNQINGLIVFSKCNKNNLGLVFIKFEYVQECYIVHIYDILNWVSEKETFSFSRNELNDNLIKNLKVERRKDLWDLKNINEELNACYS